MPSYLNEAARRFGRHMLGYPRIDIGNDYLMARYDGAILDGQARSSAGCRFTIILL